MLFFFFFFFSLRLIVRYNAGADRDFCATGEDYSRQQLTRSSRWRGRSSPRLIARRHGLVRFTDADIIVLAETDSLHAPCRGRRQLYGAALGGDALYERWRRSRRAPLLLARIIHRPPPRFTTRLRFAIGGPAPAPWTPWLHPHRQRLRAINCLGVFTSLRLLRHPVLCHLQSRLSVAFITRCCYSLFILASILRSYSHSRSPPSLPLFHTSPPLPLRFPPSHPLPHLPLLFSLPLSLTSPSLSPPFLPSPPPPPPPPPPPLSLPPSPPPPPPPPPPSKLI